MPLVNNNDNAASDQNRNRSPSKSWWKQKKWWLSAVVAVLIALVGYVVVVPEWNHYTKAQAADALAQQNLQKDQPVNKGKTPANLNLSYQDDNHRITTGDDLKKAADSNGTLYLKGYFGAPSQKGLEKIPAMPINAGVSDRVLAYGAGEVKPDRAVGQGNYVIAFHNFPYGKALQHMNPNQKPKVYISDKQKVYEYELSSEKSVYKAGEAYSKAIQQTTEPRLTVYTCDEPYTVWIPRPDNRLVASGKLVATYPVNDAPKAAKETFAA
ncbi:sortase domain-bontaining protein [Weissella viridescens]|uniref:sortase domain-containing protein n=1 Tax=Weissella viridescens TaxID=1629 RepID=UPI003AF2D4FB